MKRNEGKTPTSTKDTFPSSYIQYEFVIRASNSVTSSADKRGWYIREFLTIYIWYCQTAKVSMTRPSQSSRFQQNSATDSPELPSTLSGCNGASCCDFLLLPILTSSEKRIYRKEIPRNTLKRFLPLIHSFELWHQYCWAFPYKIKNGYEKNMSHKLNLLNTSDCILKAIKNSVTTYIPPSHFQVFSS